ncbi:MAG: L,D-transpeptidase [Xanthobacteraceae bacterium]|nr:L,D-transpeptidase [Xanthobacteraceae bacterium]
MLKNFSLIMCVGAVGFGAGAAPAAALERAYPVASAADAQPAPVRVAFAERRNMGGGFIEFLFGDEQGPRGYPAQPSYDRRPIYPPSPERTMPESSTQQMMYRRNAPVEAARSGFDPKYEKQLVEYHGSERPGTIVVDTPNKFLYLVQGGGAALRYGIGVGRPGFTWSGVKTITAKKEWPSWTPPAEMLKRRPDLPRFMEGGPENPLGARAMYLGSSLYRIHGSNEPWTIGTNVSSGCIRMRNEDVIDLYGRVNVGARVVVI